MTHALTLSSETLASLGQTRNLPIMAVVAVRLAVCVTTWTTRARTRKALAKLDPHQLQDVGVTPAQAQHEAAKAFWLS